VHEHDGHARRPASKAPAGRSRSAPRPAGAARRRGADALLASTTALVQQLGQHDAAVEQPRPGLVGDAQRVAEARVVTSSVRSPLRSSSALVATVVPIFTPPPAPA
jgi:hypothetical protein